MLKILFSSASRKAWVAGLTALLTALIVSNRDGVIDLTDWLTTALATVTAVGAVFGIRNEKNEVK